LVFVPVEGGEEQMTFDTVQIYGSVGGTWSMISEIKPANEYTYGFGSGIYYTSDMLYLVTAYNDDGGLVFDGLGILIYQTSDGGKTWDLKTNITAMENQIWDAAVSMAVSEDLSTIIINGFDLIVFRLFDGKYEQLLNNFLEDTTWCVGFFGNDFVVGYFGAQPNGGPNSIDYYKFSQTNSRNIGAPLHI